MLRAGDCKNFTIKRSQTLIQLDVRLEPLRLVTARALTSSTPFMEQ